MGRLARTSPVRILVLVVDPRIDLLAHRVESTTRPGLVDLPRISLPKSLRVSLCQELTFAKPAS
jgi:hypothetical protein